jgi:hypothetical protein
MKRERFFRSRRMRFFAVVAVAALAWAAWTTSADDDKKKDKSPWSGAVWFGGGGVDKEGLTGISGLSAGRAAEYLVAKSSPIFGAQADYNAAQTYWRLGGYYLATDEAAASVFGSSSRVFTTDTGISRFLHRLDNDQAGDWAGKGFFALNGDSAGLDMRMTVTELRSFNRFKIPSLPGATLYAHIRTLWRAGDRQARTFDHCTACHVTAAAQSLDQRTAELAFGGEIVRSNVALRYEHTYRGFDDSSAALTHDYINRFGNFDLEGVQPYAVTPDNSRNSDLGAARVDFGVYGSAVAKVRRSSTTNKSTDNSADATSFSGLVTVKPSSWVNLRGRYDRREENNETPLASERTMDRFEGVLTVRPVKAFRLEGSYRWERIDRSGGTELERTTTKSYRFKGTLRPGRNLRLTASWRHADVEDPFGRILRNSFSRIEGVLLSPFGTDEDDLLLMLSYNPVPGGNLTASYSWRKSENASVNLETKLQFFSLAGSYAAAKGVTLTGGFSRYANDVDRDVYLGVLAPLLEIINVPYDGRGTTAYVGAWFELGGGFSLKPGYSYTRAESGFSDADLGAGAAAYAAIDATAQRLGLEALQSLTEDLDLWFSYFLDDYGDANLPAADGTVQWFFGGLQYKF